MENTTVSKLAKDLNIDESIILSIMATYNHMSVDTLETLERETRVNRCTFIGTRGYSSNKSNGTEIADFTMNIGISYGNAVEKSLNKLFEYKVETIQDELKEICMGWSFKGVGFSKFTNPTDPHTEVFNLLPTALTELQTKAVTDKKPRKDNNIKLNKVLWFNTESKNLLLWGKVVKKSVKVADTSGKITQSAPLTVAKDIIRSTLNTNSLTTLAIPNVLGNIAINGTEIELS